MNIEQLYKIYQQYNSVQTDTRQLKNGDIYFALKGPNFNGNHFAKQALDAGASYAIIDEDEFSIEGKTILVPDVLQALQELALHHRKQLSIPVIAITGSNGKTTTKELVHAVLSSTYKTTATAGNLNNHIGVPLTILRIPADTEMAIIEMGANHAGEIASYCKIALPTHGLITNCGKAHLEGFGSLEGVKKAKGELFDYLRTLTHGYAFVMWDYDYLQQMSKGISGIIKYGTGEDVHVKGHVTQSLPYMQVKITQGLNNGIIHTHLAGDYNLPNVLAAVTIGDYFKVPDEKIVAAIENYHPANSRSQVVQIGSNQVIMDAYNANPSSMKLAIEHFARINSKNKILLLGSMAELGPETENEHKALVDEIKKHPWKYVALVGEGFKKSGHPYLQFDNSIQAKEWFQKAKIHDSHILVKGSRSMQMEKIME